MLATANKTSSSCTGAMTSELSLASLEAVINRSGKIQFPVRFRPVSCHDTWGPKSMFWNLFMNCPNSTNYINKGNEWTNSIDFGDRTDNNPRNGTPIVAKWFLITPFGSSKHLVCFARLLAYLGIWRIAFPKLHMNLQMTSKRNSKRLMRATCIEPSIATHMTANAT